VLAAHTCLCGKAFLLTQGAAAMLTPDSYYQLKSAIHATILDDCAILDQLRREVRVLQPHVQRIQPRSTTAISLVAADGGSHRIQYDPFLMELVRVVDSQNNEYCLEAITPGMNLSAKSASQFDASGRPVTALGYMMAYLGVRHLAQLSQMIVATPDDRAQSPNWIDTYRQLVEWAILFKIVRTKEFASDTLIVFDGLLRTKAFSGDLFVRYLQGLQEAIVCHYQRTRRRLFIAGVAKHSKVLTRYRLAMALEGILATDYPAFVAVPRDLERKSYLYKDFVGDDAGEGSKVVGGKLFFVKFGNRPADPVWPIDIFTSQREEAPAILGYLLADAQQGFPIACYPLCLQKAHEHAALVDFDFDILQDQIFEGIRAALGHEAPILDRARVHDEDPARARYGV
jgi:hypothetical protein